jgi:hypothetical protein
MPKTKLQMPVLDTFVLFLIRDGVNTLYRLLREGGVSVGAASPAVQRLLKAGLIDYSRDDVKGKPLVGPRGKLQMKLASFARPFLKAGWLLHFEERLPTDIDSVARLVAIAQAENKVDIAIKALDHAIAYRIKRADQTLPLSEQSKIAAHARSILQACEAARMKAEVAVLEKVRSALK